MSTVPNGPAPLEWVLTTTGSWELLKGVAVQATLEPGERAWIATAGALSWTLQRVGLKRPRIVVRPVGELAEVAHVQHDWHGHRTLCIGSGPCYDLERSPSGLVVRTTEGARVARLDWTGRHDSAAAVVHVDSPEATGPSGRLLLLVAGSVLVDDLFDPSLPRTIGTVSAPTVRSRFP